MAKLSIITICYNDMNAHKTCESIVDQTWQDFEWIVIDGGSKKEILNIFEKYKNRINTFVSESDNGIYNAYNKGLNLANGEWVYFLNSGDCLYDKTVLEKIFKDKEYSADIIYGNMKSVKNQLFNKGRIYNAPDEIKQDTFINDFIFTPSTFIKADLFKKYGGFDENYKIVSDLECWLKFQKNNAKFEKIDVLVSLFDMQGISSNSKHKALHLKERQDVFNRYFSAEEFELITKNHKNKLTFMQKVFSIINLTDGKHKQITILGIPIKIKRRYK